MEYYWNIKSIRYKWFGVVLIEILFQLPSYLV